MFNLENYNYNLPERLIAQEPHYPADECKMLFCSNIKGDFTVQDKIFKNISNLIDKNTTIFFNNTKVLRARIPLINTTIVTKNGDNKTINEGEIFFLKQISEYDFEALVRPGKKILPGSKILLNDTEFTILESTNNGRLIRSNNNPIEVFEKYGQLPLPPYIEYSKEKENPYQPIFAKNLGSVASPTASLHFTDNLLKQLKEKGVNSEYLTLHVGLGTFKPVDIEDITKYDIHEEIIEINKNIFDKIANLKLENQSILAVGTTVTRSLESLPYFWFIIKNSNLINIYDTQTIKFWNKLTENIDISECKKYICKYEQISNEFNNITDKKFEKFSFSTKIYIYPGFKFKVIDELITNFHLPKSSLLMLVSAFMGYENMNKAYEHAIHKEYKFFSFGDAMYIRNY